ncbi:FAD:protein FMN transferase [Runella aurantiaca]|uniref:FAD:protein FMN transferase n=1 Tax=Runella aurantiaca TaxID=2282308 RepID=A0A369I2R8_9BACT|nr:FAD:protein FMN transferase [Runella aurantiaca]RDB04081.1 FAD:protein FMN transferase [Runella aurantiaca]
MRKLFWGLLGLVYALVGCKSRPSFTYLEGQAQGTTFRIVYADSRDFSKAIDSLFRAIDHSMSLWDSTSIISRFNRNSPGTIADAHFEKVFNKSQEVAKLTEGAFDITVGPLVKAWGFSYKKGLPLPTPPQVDSLLQWVGYQNVSIENGVLLKGNSAIEIDFNAIAQGYTVDVMAEFLKAHGINDYLVEIGGEVRAEGHNEKGQIWQIGIDKPTEKEETGRPLQTVVSLNGKSLATSGSYRKFVMREGKKYSHAIDPKTGNPITHNLLSISVIAEDCMTADAFATAFLVMGLEKAKVIAQQQRLELYGIYATPEGKLQTFATAHFFSTSPPN